MNQIAASSADAYCTSGPSPTRGLRSTPTGVHLLGIGSVGRAWLATLPASLRLLGATDRSGTVLARRGLPPDLVAWHKQSGRPLRDWLDTGGTLPGVHEPTPLAAIVVDLTATDPARGRTDAGRIRAWLDRGQRVALASKHAVVADPTLLEHPNLGANGVLGGTGARLQAQLPELRAAFHHAAVAGSATSTVILAAIEAGGTLSDGLEVACRQGVLEPDPELDLRGTDAALKLALVAGALLGRPVDPATIAVQDLRSVDLDAVRARPGQGRTTRLIGRVTRDGRLSLRYEAVRADDPLANPPDRLVYAYDLGTEMPRVHVGHGLGADGTARATQVDVDRFLVEPGAGVV